MIVIAIFCILAISTQSNAKSIDVFEIRGNKNTNELSIQPIKLSFNYENKEPTKEQFSPNKNKVDDITKNMLNKLQIWKLKKAQVTTEAPKEPIVVILSEDPNIVNELLQNTVDSNDGDFTRTLVKEHNDNAMNELHRLIQGNQTNRKPRNGLRSLGRLGRGRELRTAAPRHRFIYDRK